MAETVLLTRYRLLDLSLGLKQLDAIRESEKEVVPLAFDSKIAYALLRNAEVVDKEVARFNTLDRQLAKGIGIFEHMPVTPPPGADAAERAACEANAQKGADYQHKRAELLEEEVKLEGITLVSVDELLTRPEEFKKSKRNPIPQSVLARLAPIIKNED